MIMSEVISPGPRPSAANILFKAIGSGAVTAIAGMEAWGQLLAAAAAHPGFSVWVVPAMGLILALGAAWLKWGPWPKTGLEFRRDAARLNRVSMRVFGLAMAAGLATMLTGFALYVAHRSLGGMGSEAALRFPHAPFIALLPGLVMAGLVAGAVEEVAFRGFMQTVLERRFGIVPAILISGSAWAVFHLNHSYFGEEPLLWPVIFLCVASMLGTIAYRSNSLILGIAVHASFDSAYFIAAGLLAPVAVTPIAWVRSFASPATLLAFAGVAGMVAIVSWIAFFRATAQRAR